MPVSYNQLQKFTLFEASGRIIAAHCLNCGRRVNYLALDLWPVVGMMRCAQDPPFPCSRCGTDERTKVWHISLRTKEAQGLTIRRPVKHGDGWRWRNETLSGP